MLIYFIRHGESEANILRQFSNRGVQHPLTEKGCRQAVLLAELLQDKHIAHIYTSPLLRAVQTAEIISDTLQVSFTPTGALREFDCGILEGKSDPESWQQYDRLLEDWFILHKWDSRIPQGESFDDIRARFVPFLKNLYPLNRNLALIGHGGLYRAILPLVLENLTPDYGKDHHLGNTGYVIAALKDSHLECLEWQP